MATPRTKRENVLLLVLAVVVGSGYVLWRYRPLKAEIDQIAVETKDAIDKRISIVIPPPPKVDAETLNKQLTAMKSAVDWEQTRVDELHRQFASTDADLQHLKVEIASLAPLCGVKIKSSVPYKDSGNRGGAPAPAAPAAPRFELPPDFPEALRAGREGGAASKKLPAADTSAKFPELAPGPFVNLASMQAVTGRQLEHLTIEGSFNGLRKFLMGLDSLRWRVTVVRLEEVLGDQRPDGVVRTPTLRASLILGM